MQLSWNAVSGATGYQVEAGSAAGGTNLLSTSSGGTTSYKWTDPPAGRTFVRVRSLGANAVSSDVSLVVFDFRDYIESLFLGGGPLVPSNGSYGCYSRTYHTRFRAGRTITVVISSSVPANKIPAIEQTMADIRTRTAGQLTINVTQSADPDPRPATNQDQVTIAVIPSTIQLCSGNEGGCAIGEQTGTGTMFGVRIVVNPAIAATDAGFPHELSHALLGLCHVDGNAIGGGDMSLMGAGTNIGAIVAREVFSPRFGAVRLPGRLSDWDLAAVEAVFSAGIQPGMQRADFVARGLMRP